MVTEIRAGASHGDLVRSLSNALPSLESGCFSLRPFQIVSLLYMLQFYAGFFHVQTELLCSLEKDVRRGINERGEQAPLTRMEAHNARQVFDLLGQACEPLQLKRVLERLEQEPLKSISAATFFIVNLEKLNWHLREIRDAITKDLYERLFLYVPLEDAGYYNKDDLFGIKDKFGKANKEIKLAGNCYATGNHTACVFHLTRVLERGLWALAQEPRLGITIQDPGIETWETLINRIESAITNLQQVPKTGDKLKNLDLFSGAAIQFRYFKDHWRNPVSHLKADYDGPQALSALNKVRDFMQYLANTEFREGST